MLGCQLADLLFAQAACLGDAGAYQAAFSGEIPGPKPPAERVTAPSGMGASFARLFSLR
jgi:hypothetical protein